MMLRYNRMCAEWNSPEGFSPEERMEIRDNTTVWREKMAVLTSLMLLGYKVKSETQ